MNILAIAAAAVTALVALIVIAWAVRALFFRDLGGHARPSRDDGGGWEEYTRQGYPAALPHKYGRVGDYGPAPYERYLPAPAPAAAPAAPEQPGTVRPGREPAAVPPPVIHHDEYALPQRWHPQPPAAPAPAAGLTPVMLVVVAAWMQQQAWHTKVLEPFPDSPPFADCLSDDTMWRGMRAIEGGA